MGGEMDRKASLIFETILLTAPAVFIVVWGLPNMIVEVIHLYRFDPQGIGGISPEGWFGCLRVIGGAAALIELIRLATRTINGRPYRFGVWFFMAAGFGLVAAHYLYQMFGIRFAVFVFAPLLFLALHMHRLQMRLAKAT